MYHYALYYITAQNPPSMGRIQFSYTVITAHNLLSKTIGTCDHCYHKIKLNCTYFNIFCE